MKVMFLHLCSGISHLFCCLLLRVSPSTWLIFFLPETVPSEFVPAGIFTSLPFLSGEHFWAAAFSQSLERGAPLGPEFQALGLRSWLSILRLAFSCWLGFSALNRPCPFIHPAWDAVGFLNTGELTSRIRSGKFSAFILFRACLCSFSLTLPFLPVFGKHTLLHLLSHQFSLRRAQIHG